MTRISVRIDEDAEEVVLPRSVADLLGIAPGESAVGTTTDSGLLIGRDAAEIDRQVEAGLDVMRRYAETMKRLAR
jgi:hypothetical protein